MSKLNVVVPNISVGQGLTSFGYLDVSVVNPLDGLVPRRIGLGLFRVQTLLIKRDSFLSNDLVYKTMVSNRSNLDSYRTVDGRSTGT